MIMDAGIPHTLMEYFILLLFGGGGARWAYTYRRNKGNHAANSTKLKEYIEDAHKPLLSELKDLCKITKEMKGELHDYIVIQKDRDARGDK